MISKNNNKFNNNFLMSLALLQAKKNIGNTKTNPSVGCIIEKNGIIVGAGNTSFNGQPHAEVNAMKFSRSNIKNSNLYTTLEPCSHYGKTPPCLKKIIKKKIKKVFYSINDPDLRSYKKSKRILNKNNIKVQSNVFKAEVKKFYKSYLKFKKRGLPFVTAKLAVSNDYFTKSNKKEWITNEFSRGRVHLMRSSHDALITSVNTILDDKSKLNCRINGLEKTSPTKFVIDKNLKISISSNVIKMGKKHNTFIFYNKINQKKIIFLKKKKIKLIRLNLNKNLNFNLIEILNKIKQLGFSRVFIESGINLIKNFLNENLINEFYLFVSEKKLGKKGKLSFKKNFYLMRKLHKFFYHQINLHGDKLMTFIIK